MVILCKITFFSLHDANLRQFTQLILRKIGTNSHHCMFL